MLPPHRDSASGDAFLPPDLRFEGLSESLDLSLAFSLSFILKIHLSWSFNVFLILFFYTRLATVYTYQYVFVGCPFVILSLQCLLHFFLDVLFKSCLCFAAFSCARLGDVLLDVSVAGAFSKVPEFTDTRRFLLPLTVISIKRLGYFVNDCICFLHCLRLGAGKSLLII